MYSMDVRGIQDWILVPEALLGLMGTAAYLSVGSRWYCS